MRKRIFIIDECHQLTHEAWSVLLKILEEPPQNTVFLLIAAKTNLLLPTLISRSYALDFKRLPSEEVERLLESSGLPPEEAAALSLLSGGSVKKARDIKKVRDSISGTAASGLRGIFKLVSGLPRESYLAREEAKLLLDMLLASARKNWRC